MSEKRVVVVMPADMARFLEERAKSIGVGNVSAYVRLMVRNEMEETKLRTMVPGNA